MNERLLTEEESASSDADSIAEPTPAPSAPLAYQVVRGGLWVVLSSYWAVIFGFAANIVLARLIAPQAYGEFALAMFIAQLTRLQPKLALSLGFARQKNTTGESVGTYLIMEFAAAAGGVVLTALSIPLWRLLGYTPAVVQLSIPIALFLMLEGLSGAGAVLLEKDLHFRQTSLIQSVAFPLSYLPAFWLAARGGGAWSLVLQNFTHNMLILPLIWTAVRRQLPVIWKAPKRFNRQMATHFLRYGIVGGLGGVAAMLVTQLDNFLVGTFVDVTTLGYYDRAYRTAQWPSILFNTLTVRTAFYTYAKLQDDRIRLQKTVNMVVWIITTVALPVVLVVFITAPDLLTAAYTAIWLPSTPYLRILVLIAVVRPLWENAGVLLGAIGKVKLPTVILTLQVVVLAVVGFPLTMTFGATGTCIAVGLAFAVAMTLIYLNVVRYVPIQLGTAFGLPALAGIMTLLGYFALSRLSGLNELELPIRLCLKVMYAVVAFFAGTFVLQPRATVERVGYLWRLIRQARQ